jgi:hypothetical protein
LQRYVNIDHPKDTVESKYYSNGSEWYIHLEKENVSYQTEYYFNHNKKWEMIQNHDTGESLYNEWSEKRDTVKSEITKNNSKQIHEFEFGKVVRKYNRDEQGINGDYWELHDNKWIKQFYINGIRQIETHPILIHYPDAAQTFKKLYTQYSTASHGVYGYKEVSALDDKDQHYLVEHYIQLQNLFTEKKLEIHQFEVKLGRSTDCSFFVIKSMIASPVIILIYDNGYHEFLNRTNDWTSLQLWNEQINFKWD